MEIEIIKKLNGMSLLKIYNFLISENPDFISTFEKYNVCGITRGRMIDFLINYLNNNIFYQTKKGTDFNNLELKCITLINERLPGDTPISCMDYKSFDDSNVIKKLKNIILVIIKDLKIVDIRIFNYKKYEHILKKDWINNEK